MVVNYRKLLIVCFSVCFPFFTFAQRQIKEGKVFFDMSYPKIPEHLKQYQSMMPNDASLYFKNGKSRVEMPNPMGKITTITDSLQQNITVLMNLPGHKIALRKTKEEMKQVESDLLNGLERPKTHVVLKPETKEIAGFICHRAIIYTGNDSLNVSDECWYSTELPPLMLIADSGFDDIKGMVMEYNTHQEGIECHLKVRKVFDEAVGDVLFEIPSQYKIVTEEELMKIMNGQ